MAAADSTPIGSKFNFLTIIDHAPSRDWKRYALMRCDCGVEKILHLAPVIRGVVKSCSLGCPARARSKNPDPEIGARFDKLTVIGPFWTDRSRWAMCVCDCGKEFAAKTSFLKRGVAKSCGCLVRAPKHGHAVGYKPTRVYRIWEGIHTRCKSEDTGREDWPRYGGKGIRVCDRWKCFENFLEDMGEPPAGTSIDRIDPRGNYEPGNCRWSTAKAQANNTRANRIIEFSGEFLTLAQWCEKLALPYPRTYYRLFVANWPIEKALTDPRRDNHDR